MVVIDVINARGVYLIFRGLSGDVFKIDRRNLKGGGYHTHNCNKLNKSNTLSAKISREFKNSAMSTPLIRRLEIHIAHSNPNIDVRIFARNCCVAIVSLPLF